MPDSQVVWSIPRGERLLCAEIITWTLKKTSQDRAIYLAGIGVSGHSGTGINTCECAFMYIIPLDPPNDPVGSTEWLLLPFCRVSD